MMKLTSVKLIALCAVISLPAIAQDKAGNPFIKPSERTEVVEDSCDIAIIEQMVQKKLADIAPRPKGDKVDVASTEISNRERILQSGAKLINHVNGVDVYFDETLGVFLYDDTRKPDNKG